MNIQRTDIVLHLLGFLFLSLNVSALKGSTVTLTKNDGDNHLSSFNAAGNWSDNNAPSDENDYTTSTFVLSTPNTDQSYTFQGHSLTIPAGGKLDYGGYSSNPTASRGTTVTIPKLILSGGTFFNAGAGNTATLAGNITLTEGTDSKLIASGGKGPWSQPGMAPSGYSTAVTVTARIEGAGSLTVISGGSAYWNNLTISSRNTYTGGTTIQAGALFVTDEGTLGTGTVMLQPQTILNLSNGSGMDSSAVLALGDESTSVVLSYNGTLMLAGLKVVGKSMAAGTYGGKDSGASNILPELSGTGTITVTQ
jgi:fibronectin-binding autotransporter adhesin